jgi:hypothetical protein
MKFQRVGVSSHSREWARAGLAIGLVVLLLGAAGCASSGDASGSEDRTTANEEADSDSEGRGKLEPRYQPREPQPKPWYNNAYLFGMTRGVTGSTMHPAVKVPLLVLTVPLDIVFLPFSAIGGLFG